MKVKRILLTIITICVITCTVSCGKKDDGHKKEKEDLILNKEVMTKDKLAKITPDMVLDLISKGNERFFEGITTERDFVEQAGKLKNNQFPYACILTTSDSRMCPEIIFDQGLGDLYSIRIDGINPSPEVLGGVEYAVKGIGVKLVLVLGQSNSSAVKNACDGIELGNISAMVKDIKAILPQVQTAPDEPRNSKNADFVAKVSKQYMLFCLRRINEASQIVRESAASGGLKLIGGIYNTEDGKVSYFDMGGNPITPKDAPRNFSPEEHHEGGEGEHNSEHNADSTHKEAEHKTEEGYGGH